MPPRFNLRWDEFYYSPSNRKYLMFLIFPAAMCYIRWRAETMYSYNVYITENKLYPTYNNKSFSFFKNWSNGKQMYIPDRTTVEEFKNILYKDADIVPEVIAVGCRGRMMDDSDVLALATRAFCKRDPRLLIWQDEFI
eukprot:GHVR01148599.1.p1 GENE.GHVR01148599.1~~GHVR01148599.1.p1  ORF type:complete len:138 (+),score=25.46 GHVR01148599.1:82-495(+)